MVVGGYTFKTIQTAVVAEDNILNGRVGRKPIKFLVQMMESY